MLTCEWAETLTRYDCKTVRGISGSNGLRIGTPFSLPDGAAINIYLMEAGEKHVLISDNGDTLAHLSALGIDLAHHSRMRALREMVGGHGITLSENGDFTMLAQQQKAAWSFARSITGLLAVAQWAREQLKDAPREHDLVAEAEPYILARSPGIQLRRHVHVRGASMTDHVFDFQQGTELIDIIFPNAQATGAVMRKVGDVVNGPFADQLSPLIIVDDRSAPQRAQGEMAILASIARTQPFSRLMTPLH
jgi:hypothetical protein